MRLLYDFRAVLLVQCVYRTTCECLRFGHVRTMPSSLAKRTTVDAPDEADYGTVVRTVPAFMVKLWPVTNKDTVK